MVYLLGVILACAYLPSLVVAFSSLQPSLLPASSRQGRWFPYVVARQPFDRNISLGVGGMMDLNDENYAKLLNGQKATLVDACAIWCGPCKLIEPVLDRCATKWSETIEMAKFDVEAKNPNLKVVRFIYFLCLLGYFGRTHHNIDMI